MDEAPRKKRTFPLLFRTVQSSRFSPVEHHLMTEEEKEAHLAAEARRAAQKALAPPAEPPLETSPEPPPAVTAAPIAPPGPSAPPDFSRHARRCSVCAHPDRDAIEGDFIRWRSPDQIAQAYNITGRVSIYRHAHAVGLFRRRKREVARVLESFLESAESCPLEAAEMIIRATRLYVRLNEHGEWVEPPKTQYIVAGPPPSASPSEPPPVSRRSRSRRAVVEPVPALPARKRRARNQKFLTATDPNSKNRQPHENK